MYNPDWRIPKAPTRIHGISCADVEGKPKFADEAEELREFIGDLPPIAHNLQFDRGFLSAEFKRAGVKALRLNKGLCTMLRFQDERGGQRKGSRLEDAANAFGVGGRKGSVHGAEEDALLAAKVAAGFYCADNGIGKPGRSGGWLKGLLWVAAIVAGLALLAS